MGGHRSEDVVAIARRVLASRFPGALCAFVAGSILRGQGTVASDIDLVVVFDRVETGWREFFSESGFPVEAFVHDPETLGWFIDTDAKSGFPIIVDMVASGHVIGSDLWCADALKAHAAKILAAGPAPLAPPQLNALRYVITDLVDDLRGERSSSELRAIAARLFQPLADLALLGRNQWSGKGKWIPRLLEKLDDFLARNFDEAFRLAMEGNPATLIAFAETELARHGGPYFAGDRREAPAEARLASIRGELGLRR
ncbi:MULTISPECIES: nucleotidyltransferase domain-containing protein [unclassified Sinorhizobium]|uniref:nucleotidyltransferase domain-containing protein n=1 Tax=unclassified Sinorhizobium TaxID=2613772 RepID=UPI003524D03E